jgi:DNA repair protein SbcC/Rad50
MQLKRINLKNIRSYEEEEVTFNSGATLLSGDIGSGKTSILLAIEFALFGLQPGQKGSSLLKNGKDTGEVSMELIVDENEIKIERSLKRGKAISQEYCAIEVNGEKEELSVTELKDKILTILNYPKEFSKKQNILYKFTVYTPQEEMKQIILEDSKTRLNTLRHVFGVDKYKKILENSNTVLQKIREEKRFKQALVLHFDKDKDLLQSKKENILKTRAELETKKQILIIETKNREKIEEEIKEFTTKIEERKKFEQEIEKTKIMITTKDDSLITNSKTIKNMKSEIEEFLIKPFDETKIDNAEIEILKLKKEKEELLEKNLEITSKINSLSLKNQEIEKTKSDISKLDMCPTCLQDVDLVYKSNMANKMHQDISTNVKEIEVFIPEKRKISESLNKITFDIEEKTKLVQSLKIEKIQLQTITEKKQKILELEKLNETLLKDIEILNAHTKTLTESSFELGKYKGLFEEKNTELETARKKERGAEITVAELNKEILMTETQIEELMIKIEENERIKNELTHLIGLDGWMATKFIPVIQEIERNVMINLKNQFSKTFSDWFSMLVSESFNVRLSDDFTPIIEQHDYELDYAYLSGGERTAIALAYRLALNQVINSIISKIKTKDLVILDEPTDGFSSQQLDKMREVLEQLDVAQLLIVSHEQKMEGFVENVIRFNKNDGISRKE